MFFRLIYDDALAQAAYLIGCQRTGEAIVIDPQRDVDRYIKAAHEQRLRITAVAETHIHADFLSGVRELAEQTGAKVYVSDEGDADWKYQWLNSKSGGGSYQHQLLHDGDRFRIGNIELQVLHTPGHTPEHICFLVTDRAPGIAPGITPGSGPAKAAEPMGIVTGDFVFVGDLGRPDLLETAAGIIGTKDASARQLCKSARQFNLMPEYLQVWPGHGAGSACGKALGAVPQTTVGYEKRFNPALAAAGDEAAFVRFILQGQPEPPLYFARMKQLNKQGPAILGQLPRPRPLAAAELLRLPGEAVVIDTRPWPQFKEGHLPGALSIPLGGSFPTIAGSYVDPRSPIVLVIDEPRVEQAVRLLVRVGLDRMDGYATPGTIEALRAGPGAGAGGAKLATTPEIDIAQFKQRLRDDDAFVLDVRSAAEHEAGRINGTLNIVHTRLPARLDEIPRDRPVLVHCQSGARSAMATALLQRHGFDATNIAGGFSAWEKSGGEVVHEAAHAVR